MLQLVMAIECDVFVGTRGVSLISRGIRDILIKCSLDGIGSLTLSAVYGLPHVSSHFLKLGLRMIG